MWCHVVFVTALVVLASARSVHYRSSGDGKLHLITVSAERVEGKFFNSIGSIHFISESNYLFLGTMDSEDGPLLVAEQPIQAVKLIQVLGTEFLELKQSTGAAVSTVSEFVIPSSLSGAVKSAVKSSDAHKLEKALQDVRQAGINSETEKQQAFNRLLMSTEAMLLEKAARKLEASGINGRSHPAVLPFLMIAMRVTEMRNDLQEEMSDLEREKRDQHSYYSGDDESVCKCGNDSYLGNDSYSRNDSDSVDDESECETRSECSSERCPAGDNCFGMCGNGCTCWTWVCGDCCVNTFCHHHDRCCEVRGFWTWRCLVPLSFLSVGCDEEYEC